MPKQKNLYQHIVDVTTDYLGPAAERFVVRQIQNHLGKEPERITLADIPILITWCKPAMALLTNDHSTVEEYATRLETLPKRVDSK